MTQRNAPCLPDPRKPRRRTRLRSGKLADVQNRFIAHCQIVNRTLQATGARLRLLDATPVPQRCRLFDDELAQLFEATIIWRQGRELGVALQPIDGTEASADGGTAALSGKFYAIGRH